MIESLKTLARTRLPDRIYGPIRARRVRRFIDAFEPRTVRHDYAGFGLTLSLEDPLAPGWYDRDWNEPAEITELRKGRLRPGARIIDIGAHQGVIALILAGIAGPDGAVVAVEAEPHNAAVARRNALLNDAGNVTVVHAAAAARSGVVSFTEGLNGKVARDGYPGAIEVAAVTVDELAARHGHPDVVFIDVEGYEAHVLAGARAILAAAATDFFVELHADAMLASSGSTAADVLAHFADERFDVVIALVDETPPGTASAQLETAWHDAASMADRDGRRCFVIARPRSSAGGI